MIVSLAVVAYNEENTLTSLLNDICRQDYPLDKIDLLLIDSCSKDNTANIMLEFMNKASEFYSCRFFINKKKQIPCGHNIAIDNFLGDSLIRIDAHASIPCDFISKNVKVLSSGELASGGRRPNISDRNDSFGKTLLSAENSVFGSGFAPYRTGSRKQYSASLFCGMYKREVFTKVGKYIELLPRSEDNEMCHRMRKAGFRLCYSPEIVFYQYMRPDLSSMLSQKFQNGYWIGKTVGISPGCFSAFHFVPFLFVISLIFTSFLLYLGFWKFSFLLWAIYLVAVLGVTVLEIIKKPVSTHIFLPVIFFLVHLSYGLGTLFGLVIMPFWLIRLRRNKYD